MKKNTISLGHKKSLLGTNQEAFYPNLTNIK